MSKYKYEPNCTILLKPPISSRFKDGVAYPWSAGVSNLILYPEAANQTLYARRAARADSGNYTCRLSNETHVLTHTVKLSILGKYYRLVTPFLSVERRALLDIAFSDRHRVLLKNARIESSHILFKRYY